MKTKDYIKQWEEATQDIATHFAYKYFGKDVTDYYWISDTIGDVYAINDYFFSLDEIVDFLKYKYSSKDMFEYKDYKLNCYNNNIKSVLNIKNYRELK